MTVSTTTRLAGPVIGTGASAALPFSFKVFADTDVEVTRNDELLVLGSDYTVALNPDQDVAPGGTVNITAGANTLAATIYAASAVPMTQGTAILSQSIFYPRVIEAAFDRATILIQQLSERLGRAVIAPVGMTVKDYFVQILGEGFRGPPGPTGAGVPVLATRTALAAFAGSLGQIVRLNETPRQGFFMFRTGTKPADPLQGLYVAGIGGYWERTWDGRTGMAEWFGAITGNGAVDNAPIIVAALAVCKHIDGKHADYFVRQTLVMNQNGTKLTGKITRRNDGLSGTRIILTGPAAATSDVFRLGTTSKPAGGVNNYLTSCEVEDILFVRDGTATVASDAVTAPCGVKVSYTLSCRLTNVNSTESPIGFVWQGTVRCGGQNCNSIRTLGNNGVPLSVGHWLHGDAATDLAGGNASLRLVDCGLEGGAGGAGFTGPIDGFRLTGKIVDSFLVEPEVSGCKRGLVINGSGVSGAAGDNIDVSIDHPVIDGILDTGISITNISPGGRVSISRPYVALSATGVSSSIPGFPFAAIHAFSNKGSIKIRDGEIHGFPAAASGTLGVIGILAESNDAIVVQGTLVNGFKRPVLLLNNNRYPVMEPEIVNEAFAASYPAISSDSTVGGRFAPRVDGMAGAFPKGVELVGTTNSKCEVACTSIDPDCLTGGAANKLVINGAQVAAVGASGTHFVIGVMT